MNAKKIILYAVLGISLLLLIKVLADRRGTDNVPPPEAPEAKNNLPLRDLPITYTMGSFDARFGISQDRFLEIAQEAKKIWEDAAARKLFEYADDGSIKLNLVYDWRQERLLKAKEQKSKLDEQGRSFDQLQSDYDERWRSLDEKRRSLDESVQSYQNDLANYNASVARWNNGEDHTDAQYQYLQRRKTELEEEQSALEKRRAELNAEGEELNKLSGHLEALAKEFNIDVENFNGALVQSRDFEKGLFDGSAINIYEFEKEEDLRLTLVHEFGHALGFDHVENPKAIMNRKLALQDVNNIQLTSDDLNLLLARIKEK